MEGEQNVRHAIAKGKSLRRYGHGNSTQSSGHKEKNRVAIEGRLLVYEVVTV